MLGDLRQVPAVLGCLPKLLFRHRLALLILILNSTPDRSRKEAKQAYNEFVKKKNTPNISRVSRPAVMPAFYVFMYLYKREGEGVREREGKFHVFAFHMAALFSPNVQWNSERWFKALYVRETPPFTQ